MPTSLSQLYNAILEMPGENLPRLAFADELESVGHQARADFIRHQIKHPYELASSMMPFRLSSGLPPQIPKSRYWVVRRGFVEIVNITVSQAIDSWYNYIFHPINYVALADANNYVSYITHYNRLLIGFNRFRLGVRLFDFLPKEWATDVHTGMPNENVFRGYPTLPHAYRVLREAVLSYWGALRVNRKYYNVDQNGEVFDFSQTIVS